MPWSGRDAMLTRWVSQFHDTEFARREADKYVQEAYAPDDARADAWMQRAFVRDQDRAAIAADPDNLVVGPSRYDLNGCYHCYGRGFIRLDVDRTHPEFGKARLCPACAGRDGDRSSHCPKCASFSTKNGAAGGGSERNQCYVCRQFEHEPAAESCRNPAWHIPGGLLVANASLDTVLRRF